MLRLNVALEFLSGLPQSCPTLCFSGSDSGTWSPVNLPSVICAVPVYYCSPSCLVEYKTVVLILAWKRVCYLFIRKQT